MRVGIMVTNFSSHPPEKWASESAAQIADVIQIAPDSIVYDSMVAAKNDFTDAVEVALKAHHETVQGHEKAAIDKFGPARLDHPLAPESDHLNDAVTAVQTAADKTMFSAHFRKPEVKSFVESTLGSHFATVRHTERSIHADKNPGDVRAKAFRARYHG
jgi:hypothetical protein